MINKNELRAAMARKGVTQKQVAEMLGVSEQTFGRRIRKGVFGTDEVQKMMSFLELESPMGIFFTDRVSCKDT